MSKFIQNKLREDLEYYHVNDAHPEADEFKVGLEEDEVMVDKWQALEGDVRSAIIPLIEKHQNNFPPDSYAVIDAIHQVFDQMFQKVER